MKAVAHTPREGSEQWHDLATHLSATAALAQARAEKFGGGELAHLAGAWHDIGKYNPAFQKYLQDAHAGRETTSAPHAVYGALLAMERGAPELSQVIYGHHAGMLSPAGIQEAVSKPETIETYQRVKAAARGVGGGASSGVAPDLHGEMLLRMVFSALVDADFLDTEAHFDPRRAGQRTAPPRPADLLPALLASQRQMMAASRGGAVNDVRGEVYRHSLEAARLPRGVFRLVAPTGAGKTRSALAFALSHAGEHGMG